MIKRLKEKVESILVEYPVTKDDDHKLVSMVWIKELGGRGEVRAMSAWDFLAKFNNHKISHVISIVRCRQKLQQLYPELRGSEYEKRQASAGEVKEEIIQWTGGLFDE